MFFFSRTIELKKLKTIYMSFFRHNGESSFNNQILNMISLVILLWISKCFYRPILLRHSCRTVTMALWFVILVFDHNASDPVVQKSCNLRRKFFFADFGNIYLYFESLFCHWNLDIYWYHSVYSNWLLTFNSSLYGPTCLRWICCHPKAMFTSLQRIWNKLVYWFVETNGGG
jgi:hypothetical protein